MDSDADQGKGLMPTETLESGEENLTYDAGVYEPASIGDFVWNDLNGDGIQDVGEPGVEGVTVTLTGTTGDGDAVELIDVTDEFGAYGFDNLEPGDYKVTFDAPAGYEFVEADQGLDDGLDSDADPANGMTPIETLESGENNDTYDAGLYEPASIGDYVWNDLNGNGRQEDGAT